MPLFPRLSRAALGVVLLPLCWAAARAVLDLLRHAVGNNDALLPPGAAALGCGYLLWMAVWLFLPQPLRAYVLAHELTHALWSLLFGGRASGLRVTPQGGSVRLTKTNLLITLAPYFFPFYTLLVILVRALTGVFVDPVPWPSAWLFLIGFTWGFHFSFTLQSLTVRQPDIQAYGRTFSYAIIWLLNLAGLSLWIVCTTDATGGQLLAAWTGRTAGAYATVLHTCASLLTAVRAAFAAG